MVWPDLSWYSVLPSHTVLVAPLHLFPTGHEVQVRSADDVPANEGYSVAVQVLKGVHVSALALALNTVVPSQFVAALPSGHLEPGGHWMQLVALAR